MNVVDNIIVPFNTSYFTYMIFPLIISGGIVITILYNYFFSIRSYSKEYQPGFLGILKKALVSNILYLLITGVVIWITVSPIAKELQLTNYQIKNGHNIGEYNGVENFYVDKDIAKFISDCEENTNRTMHYKYKGTDWLKSKVTCHKVDRRNVELDFQHVLEISDIQKSLKKVTSDEIALERGVEWNEIIQGCAFDDLSLYNVKFKKGRNLYTSSFTCDYNQDNGELSVELLDNTVSSEKVSTDVEFEDRFS